jgi:hypothetical protein
MCQNFWHWGLRALETLSLPQSHLSEMEEKRKAVEMKKLRDRP